MIIREDIHTFKHTHDADSLYIKVDGGVFCLSSWRYGLTCSKWEGGVWKGSFTPCGWKFPSHNIVPRPHSYFGKFVAQIPEEHRAVAASFPSAQIPILRLLRLSPYARQLADSVPFLLWFLAVTWDRREVNGRKVQELLLLPPTEIIAKICGTQDDAPSITLKQLRRIDIHELGPEPWEYFTQLLRGGMFQHVQHWPSIDLELLYKFHTGLQEMGDEDLAQCFLKRMLKNRPVRVWSQAIENGKTIVMLSRQIHKKELLDKFMLCHNPDELCALCRQAEELFNAPPVEHIFPVPTFKGSENIVHIVNSTELYAEGKQMHHCVFDYIEEAIVGTAVFYRVLAPKRGTLLLKYKEPGKGKPWKCEFLLACNKTPDAITKCAVYSELISAGGRLTPGNSHAVRSQYDPLFVDAAEVNHKICIEALATEESLKLARRQA